jgi:diamine N-acetyltransferase
MSIDAKQVVSLREITSETVRAVTSLSVAESQKGFVAPNAISLAQALFAPQAWYRAIYCAEEPVGFVMLEDESLTMTPRPEKPGVSVWRFMIDARFQGRGIGRAALLQVIEHVRAKGIFETLELSYVPGPGCPEPFYLGLGFRHTGRRDEGEVILEFPLTRSAA